MMQNKQSGQILTEILIAVVIASMVLFLGARFTEVSLSGEKANRERIVASQLAQETFEVVKFLAESNWHNIDSFATSTECYLASSSGAWTLTTTTAYKTVALGEDDYERYVIFEDVYRHRSTGNVTSTASANSERDPSTLRATVYIKRNDVEKVSWDFYITRWQNEVDVKDSWTSEEIDQDTIEITAEGLRLKQQ